MAAGELVSRRGPLVAYDVAAASVTFSALGEVAAERAGTLLVWSLVPRPDAGAVLAADVANAGAGSLIRCDRVDFPEDGVAFLHTHQGPGIRCLLEGRFAVEAGGRRQEVERFGAWFESGPEPVYAEVLGGEPAAFVRVMVLPARLIGTSSIRYVLDEDQARPKSQRYTVYVDELLT